MPDERVEAPDERVEAFDVGALAAARAASGDTYLEFLRRRLHERRALRAV
jgi:hypothetical protein